MTANAIVVHDLTKRFPVRRQWAEMVRGPFRQEWTTVLNGVNLEIKQGEVFGLLGPNGAGKTTLLKILSTLLLPSEGQAFVNGCDVVSSPHRVRQAVGYCSDSERSFYYRLSGIENLAFFATLNNLDSETATSRIAEALKIVDLNGAADVRRCRRAAPLSPGHAGREDGENNPPGDSQPRRGARML
ncbi:MAG: ATP-binding cassette domain-containing protein [Deltaproteobacteria bacterium]|nr:ATP-binding cassette domain-containing protein [Deltaproteobacteria bacterium]